MSKINFNYSDIEHGIYINIDTSDEDTLTELVAKFVLFTQMAGYQSGSWVNTLNNIGIEELEERYSIFDWANDTVY